MLRFVFLVVMGFCSLCIVSIARARPVVLGYSAVWRDQASPPQDYDFSGITHIARAFLRPRADGSIEVPAGYFNPVFESAAHAHGVKLLLSLGGGASGADNWIALATGDQNLHRFLDQLENLMRGHHYDGVDIDWEPMPDTPAQGLAYTSLLHALRKRFADAVITTALDDWAKQFSWADVVENVDYINLMTYDYAGPWTGKANLATNLHPPGDYPPVPGHSVEEGIRTVIGDDHVPPSKLLVGMNFWAYRFRADKIGAPFPKTDDASDDLSYQQVLDLLQTEHYQRLWDQRAAAPYLQRSGGGSVICYDDPESIRRKCEYAQHLGCGGIMIWNLGSDWCGEQAPLMDAVVQSCGSERQVLDRAALQAQVRDAQEFLQHAQSAVHDEPPPVISSLSQDQLESLNARLQQQVGLALDARWRARAGQIAPR